MALTFYTQDDALIDPEQYLAYIELEPDALRYLDSFELAESRLLVPWVEACRSHHLQVGHFHEDTVLHSTSLPTALHLLEHIYQQVTGRMLSQPDGATPHNPYRKMYTLLKAAQKEGRGVIGLCD